MASQDVLRISREITGIQRGSDLSIAVAYEESDLRHIQALIVGPPDTPYEYGFFEFGVKFGPEYPLKPPKVEARTTNSGRCRFNPNIYAGGKVCLSILGTWQGESGEQWSPAQSLESILLSIQSLMSNNPYENEPGFEDCKDEKDKEARDAYCAKIRHETLRVAVIQKLEAILHIEPENAASVPKKVRPDSCDNNDSEDFEDEDAANKASLTAPISKKRAEANARNTIAVLSKQFDDLHKRRFLWYYENYLAVIETNGPRFPDGQMFVRMPFESHGNSMAGMFRYSILKARLVRIKEALDQELEAWIDHGKRAVEQDLNIAFNLRNQFEQVGIYQQQKRLHNIDVSLLDNNPFVWIMTYFGKSGTNLNGGMFRFRIFLSPRFPEEQPRVKVETRMYHHRVSKDGTLCYFVEKTDEVKYHIEAIVAVIEDDSPPYDPRAIVHAEATRLFWGSANDRKQYDRAQRRSAQDSMDDFMT